MNADTKTEQFEAVRGHLFGLAYRALGSRADAEDVVQNAFLRWQAADTSAVESPRAFLTTVVSRLALDELKSAQRRREEYFGTWLPEPVMMSASPEDSAVMADSLSAAFLFVLESLAPAERVAFVLHHVFGEEYSEIAAVLETSEENARQLVSRARRHVRERRPRFRVSEELHRSVVRSFVDACTRNDVAALAGMLRSDAVAYSDGGGKATAAVNPIHGAERVARFFAGIAQKAPEGWSWRMEDAGGVPSLLLLVGNVVVTLITFDLDEDGRIAWVLAQRNPEKLRAATS
jgi:RNA polymerase sigma-70 factor (ECF subfamily)